MSINQHIATLLNLSRRSKRVIMLLLDVVLILLSLWLSFFLRLDTFELPDNRIIFVNLAAPFIAIPIFITNGLYRLVIRHMAGNTILAVLRAVTSYCLIWALVVFLSGVPGVPRSVILINWGICLILVGGSRFFVRWFTHVFLTTLFEKSNSATIRKALIYGAGEAGIQLTDVLTSNRQIKVVGFIDDAPSLHNQSIKGLKVYPPNKLRELMDSNISEVILAMPSVSRARRRDILSTLEPLPVQVRTVPDITAIASGKVEVQDIREVDIADLLGRETVPPNQTLLRKNIDGQVVMVTGAGGSIGSELCRQISLLNPKMLVLYEQSEFNLYRMDHALSRHDIDFVSVLGSVYDEPYLLEQCRKFGVHTIFHAAAYKHVPLVEANPKMGVQNNIVGTYVAAMAAIKAEVACFVMISTDKAVRPTNVMGATKRFSEQILQSMGNDAISAHTRFVIVRFGNVIESSGSVIPLFREQIKAGGPVTVTHQEITRYFMTIPEASQLVLQAGAMGKGGEVFVLDMGEPVKIYDLATKMIKLSGLTLKSTSNPDGDIEIKVSGLRAGEKLYEELLIGDDVSATAHAQIMLMNEKFSSWHEIQRKIHALQAAEGAECDAIIRQILSTVVEGYLPQPTH